MDHPGKQWGASTVTNVIAATSQMSAAMVAGSSMTHILENVAPSYQNYRQPKPRGLLLVSATEQLISILGCITLPIKVREI